MVKICCPVLPRPHSPPKSARGWVGGGGAYPPAVRHPMLLAGGPPLGSAAGQPGIPASVAGPCSEAAIGIRPATPSPPAWRSSVRSRRSGDSGAGKRKADARAGGGEVVSQAVGTQLRDGVQGPRADGGGAGAPAVLQPRTRRGRPASTICSELKARGAPR